MSDRRPFLYDAHVELGAKIVPFGGWGDAAALRRGYRREHLACRHDAVVFDVRHLGTVRCDGEGMFDALQSTLTNDLGKVAPGSAQYTHLLNDEASSSTTSSCGGSVRRQFDVMPNASNTSGVTSALPGVDVTRERCVLAVQGPYARARRSRQIDQRFAAVGAIPRGTD